MFCFGFILFTMMISVDAMVFDNFHCKAATCHEFYYASFCFSFAWEIKIKYAFGLLL
jgi:hypothetical protein